MYSLTSKKLNCTIFAMISLSILSACSDDEAEIAQAQEAALTGNKIECALDGTKDFLVKCATERVATKDGSILMIRHSDGGFRRFKILTDGRGLQAAEGFDSTRIEIIDDENILLLSGNDKYKLKAQFTGNPTQSAGNNPLIDTNEAQVSNEAIEDKSAEGQLSDAQVGPRGTPGVPYPIPK